ncbi:MAG: lipoyl(octanoyl) transferase LipB [Planktomarina sp.]|nr:lipoyl(octanoyl) transferase LipB [Planktomarina sp.]MDT2018693.1 lipoyl(octanoyl) transferase LipB [Planktomarina sp.]MDV3049780.1 lipoyl(octanoyl) transferase LipB [Planktomarina sp.]
MPQNPNTLEVEWKKSAGLVPYEQAVEWMERRVAQIIAGEALEVIWLLEHPPLYTAGTSSDEKDLIDPNRFPVFKAQRGGQYTYHGPGQRVVYVILDVAKRGRDVRKFVKNLEIWVINTLAKLNVVGEIRQGRVGVWVQRPDLPKLPSGIIAEHKIASIGIRLRKWVSFHGISINLDPNLEHFSGIIPCGIDGFGVTSLSDLGQKVTLNELDIILRKEFTNLF